ncbi:MAG: hypothetical protein ABSD27_05710, partial [Bryobacteraceae bacterium]
MLENEIAQLGAVIRGAVTKDKKADALTTRRLARVRRRDFTLKYHEDFGFAHFSPERIEQDIWDWRDQERFQDSVVKNLEQYKALAAALGSNSDPLETFARAVS